MSIFPTWINDIGTLSSIVGLFITIFILYEAKKIRESFLRRARLPEVIKELSTANNKISKSLQNWPNEEKSGIHQLTIAKELLENLRSKLPEQEKKKVSAFIQKLEVKSWLIFSSTITEANEDKAWELYSGLSGLITSLKQLQKDSKWD